ncbi:MAG: hypothetical protein ABSG15_00805 [FCB group bacterium]|jgi:hypothetical protein
MWIVRWQQLDSSDKQRTHILITKDFKMANIIKSLIEDLRNNESVKGKITGFVTITNFFVLGNNSLATDKLHFCNICNDNATTIKVRYESEIVYEWDAESNSYEVEEATADYDNGASISCNACGHDIYKQGEIEYPQPERIKSGLQFKTDKLLFCTNCNTDARIVNLFVPTETIFLWDEKYESYITSDTIDDNENIISLECSECGIDLIKHEKEI